MTAKLHTPVLERYRPDPNADLMVCDWPGCDDEAPHRAPRSRDEPNSFRWFCKVHASQYNKAWNFFADLTDDEVEAIVRHDTVWNRPSWPLGAAPAIRAFMAGEFDDPFGTFDNDGSDSERASGDKPASDPSLAAIGAEIRRALAVLDLEIPVDIVAVKTRYKDLVKTYHPDAPGAPADADDRIKEINHAYRLIMDFLET